MHLNALGLDRLCEIRKRFLERFREGGRVAARCLLYGKHDSLLAVERRTSAARLSRHRYVCDIAESERASVCEWNGREFQRVERVGTCDLPERDLFPCHVREVASAQECASVSRRLHYVEKRKSGFSDASWICCDTVFRKPSTDYSHLSYARDAKKPRPQIVFGNLSNLQCRSAAFLAGERDKHDLACYGHDGRDFSVCLVRQGFFDPCETFEYVEARPSYIDIPVEIDPYERKSSA